MSAEQIDEKTKLELQPAHALWKLYRPQDAPYRFKARTLAEARAWQKKVRPLLARLMGFQDFLPVPPRPRIVETVDRGDYIRQKVLLRTAADMTLPVYILVPKGVRGPLPVVLAFHGHGYGVKDIVGLWEDGSEREHVSGYHKDFAVELVRKGLLVAAPEISCFGERQSDFTHLNNGLGSPVPTTCQHSAALAMHMGRSVVGLRVLEGRRLVDYLATRKDADVTRLGAMGLSGGGMHTFFSACVDPRIKACVISGFYSTFRDSILGMAHCQCNYIAGLHDFGEMYDLIGLVAPRPVLIEAATRDCIFPMGAVKKSVAVARKVYGVFGAESNVQTDYFEGRHEIGGAKAYDFLKAQLG